MPSQFVPILIMIVILTVLLALYQQHWLKRLCLFLGADLRRRRSRVLLRMGGVLLTLCCLYLFAFPAVLLLHYFLFCALTDLAVWLWKKCFPRLRPKRFFRTVYRLSLVPLLITALVLGYGCYNMARYVRTDYRLDVNKPLSKSYRIIFLSDTHYGTVQSPALLKAAVAEINTLNADIIILGGDIVEEQTANSQMHEVFACLGGLQSRYGVYCIFGNHDKQSYSDAPAYSVQELTKAAAENGITVLEDESRLINGELLLVGRADAGEKRLPLSRLLSDTPKEMTVLVADHQPVGGEECDAAGADVLLSGHTHGGQFLPLNLITELVGSPTYGNYTFGSCQLYVSSGFAGWGYPLRTAAHCEYLVLTLY